MQALFLATGGTRRRAVIDESARVVAAGGEVTVLINRRDTWRRSPLTAGVVIVPLPHVERGHLARRIPRLFLFRAPALAFRLMGWGPFARPAARTAGAYERRIASPIDRRLLLPLYRSVWRRSRARRIASHTVGGTPLDVLVVSDPASMRDARALVAHFRRHGNQPRIVLSIDHAIPTEDVGNGSYGGRHD